MTVVWHCSATSQALTLRFVPTACSSLQSCGSSGSWNSITRVLQVARAQETLAAITGVRQALHDLHKRLAPSLTHATSDTRLDYIPSGTQHQDVDGLAVLKAKEEQLQVEVNRCRSLTAENDLLHKQLQVLLSRCCYLQCKFKILVR